MKLKYQRWLPPIVITEELVDAFAHGDYRMVAEIIDQKPWEFSPLNCQEREPKPGQTPADFAGDPWRSSWWKMMALREKLLQLAEAQEE